jgi:hypothetical protein
VAGGSLDRVLLLPETDLHGCVTIDIFIFDLGYHTGSQLDDRTRIVFTIRIEDAGHSDFLAN